MADLFIVGEKPVNGNSLDALCNATVELAAAGGAAGVSDSRNLHCVVAFEAGAISAWPKRIGLEYVAGDGERNRGVIIVVSGRGVAENKVFQQLLSHQGYQINVTAYNTRQTVKAGA
ncbi:hypothetical protein HYU15_02930 [Candidatus Woesearchaeota archaeon]|nr:hypothetical protein [Candidatus Woesearchaeota archaeon]